VIRAIYVLAEGGVCIYSKVYDSALADPLLMSSFISAVTQFSREAMGDELKVIESDDKFVYVLDHDLISIIAVVDEPDEISSNLMENIGLSFLSKFAGEIHGDLGDIAIFSVFDEMLDKIVPPQIIVETKIEPQDPLDALSIIELPSELKKIALLLLQEKRMFAKRAAAEFAISENAAKAQLEEILKLGKIGREDTRAGLVYFI